MSEKVEFRYISKEKRLEMDAADFGFVDGDRRLFPIENQSDLDAAGRLLGRAKISEDERKSAKAKIIRIAARKQLKLPETWIANMSEDLVSEVTENILFSAELNDIFDINVDDKIFTLQVIEVKGSC